MSRRNSPQLIGFSEVGMAVAGGSGRVSQTMEREEQGGEDRSNYNYISTGQMNYRVMSDLTGGVKMFDRLGGYSVSTDWLEDITAMAGRSFWGDAILLQVARQHLTGSALEWYKYYKSEIKAWSDFEEKFKKKYTDRRATTEKFAEMTNRKQKLNESAVDYFYCKMRMCKALKLEFEESKELVLLRLRENDAPRYLLMVKHKAEDELLSDIQQYERFGNGRLQSAKNERQIERLRHGEFSWKEHFHSQVPAYLKRTSERVQKMNTFSCFKCGDKGHFARECRKDSVMKCFRCGSAGHVARFCKMPKGSVAAIDDFRRTTQHVGQVRHLVACSPNTKFFKEVLVNGCAVESYIDLGSQDCALRDDLMPKLGLACD